jgi:hypothetical protein
MPWPKNAGDEKALDKFQKNHLYKANDFFLGLAAMRTAEAYNLIFVINQSNRWWWQGYRNRCACQGPAD